MQLEPYIRLFFNNWLVTGSNESSELAGQMYELLFQLYLLQAQLLITILPQLEIKVKGFEVADRIEGLQFLVRVFKAKDCQLPKENKTLWQMYLGMYI